MIGSRCSRVERSKGSSRSRAVNEAEVTSWSPPCRDRCRRRNIGRSTGGPRSLKPPDRRVFNVQRLSSTHQPSAFGVQPSTLEPSACRWWIWAKSRATASGGHGSPSPSALRRPRVGGGNDSPGYIERRTQNRRDSSRVTARHQAGRRRRACHRIPGDVERGVTESRVLLALTPRRETAHRLIPTKPDREGSTRGGRHRRH
jgi:hypothetical protein